MTESAIVAGTRSSINRAFKGSRTSRLNSLAGMAGIVTGSSRGIGLAIATHLIRCGASVVLTARKPAPLQEAVESLAAGPRAVGVSGHTDDPEHQHHAVEAAMNEFGSVDFLVNNTGINPLYGPLLELEFDAARKMVDVNVFAALGWTRATYNAWMADHGGVVVNVSSAAGLRPAKGIGLYGATKAALMHVTAQLAWELAPAVRVNAVAPVVITTRFAESLFAGREDEVVAHYPAKRLGTPDDVAHAVGFLMSEESGWITGQTLIVDGGLTLRGGVE